MSSTASSAVLYVSRAAYFEIRARLEKAGALDEYALRTRPEVINFGRVALAVDVDSDCACGSNFVCATHDERGGD